MIIAMITATLVYARNTSMEQGLNDSHRRRRKYSERNLSWWPFVHHKSHTCTGVESNPGLSGYRPVIYGLTYSTAGTHCAWLGGNWAVFKDTCRFRYQLEVKKFNSVNIKIITKIHSVDCNANRRLWSDAAKRGYVLVKHCYRFFKYEVCGWVRPLTKYNQWNRGDGRKTSLTSSATNPTRTSMGSY